MLFARQIWNVNVMNFDDLRLAFMWFCIWDNDYKLDVVGSGSVRETNVAWSEDSRRCQIWLRKVALADFLTTMADFHLSAQMWGCLIERKLGYNCSTLRWTVSILFFIVQPHLTLLWHDECEGIYSWIVIEKQIFLHSRKGNTVIFTRYIRFSLL